MVLSIQEGLTQCGQIDGIVYFHTNTEMKKMHQVPYVVTVGCEMLSETHLGKELFVSVNKASFKGLNTVE